MLDGLFSFFSLSFRALPFAKHFHDSYGIGLSDQGSGVIHCQGTKYITSPKQLIFFHPGQVHSGYANQQAPWTYRMIYLDVALVIETLQGDVSTLSFPETSFHNWAITPAFSATHDLFAQSASTLERETTLQNFVKLLYEQASGHSQVQPRVNKPSVVKLIREYLRANYQDNVSLVTLAHLTNLTEGVTKQSG